MKAKQTNCILKHRPSYHHHKHYCFHFCFVLGLFTRLSLLWDGVSNFHPWNAVFLWTQNILHLSWWKVRVPKTVRLSSSEFMGFYITSLKWGCWCGFQGDVAVQMSTGSSAKKRVLSSILQCQKCGAPKHKCIKVDISDGSERLVFFTPLQTPQIAIINNY